MKPTRPIKSLLITLGLLGFALASSYGVWLGLQFALGTNSPLVVVLSNSMAPTFYRGDLLIVQGVDDPSQVRVGDIIIFRNPTRNPAYPQIVHRVIDRKLENGRWFFVTKGDANSIQDQWLLPEDHIIGRVMNFSLPVTGTLLGRVPLVGYVAMVMQSPAGPLIIGTLILIIFLTDVLSTKKEKRDVDSGGS